MSDVADSSVVGLQGFACLNMENNEGLAIYTAKIVAIQENGRYKIEVLNDATTEIDEDSSFRFQEIIKSNFAETYPKAIIILLGYLSYALEDVLTHIAEDNASPQGEIMDNADIDIPDEIEKLRELVDELAIHLEDC